MLKQIRAQLPPDPRIALRKRIKEAVAAERFEEAAQLRDQLDALLSAMAQPPEPNASREEDSTPGSSSLPPAMPPVSKPKRARKSRQKKTDSGPENASQ